MKNPIQGQKGKNLPKFWLRGNCFRKFEYDRIDHSENKPNWNRRLHRNLARYMEPPFRRVLMSWRWGTDRNYWAGLVIPKFLSRIRGD